MVYEPLYSNLPGMLIEKADPEKRERRKGRKERKKGRTDRQIEGKKNKRERKECHLKSMGENGLLTTCWTTG